MHFSKPLLRLLANVTLAAFTGCSKQDMRQSSTSMEPTIKQGEVLSVDLAAYRGSGPSRWDVIVFESPVSGGGRWISRIVGLPGETVEIRSGGVVIDGRKEALPAHLSLGGYELPKNDHPPSASSPLAFPYKIPGGHYFVLGDHTSNALDSRYWGALDGAKILGKVVGK